MTGKIYLIGAGPGDSGLLTLRGFEVLKHADVVIYDRLVGEGILAMIPENAEKIDAGKSSGNHTINQREIESLMIAHARSGKNVVRLKGGDPFIFGRGGEEAEAIISSGLAFEVIPAKIGVEQGLPINANTIPKMTGYKYMFIPSFLGISLIITGISKSKIPNSFNPIIMRIEATIKPKYPPAKVTKTFPVRAQITPITENTIAVPNTKNNI